METLYIGLFGSMFFTKDINVDIVNYVESTACQHVAVSLDMNHLIQLSFFTYVFYSCRYLNIFVMASRMMDCFGCCAL